MWALAISLPLNRWGMKVEGTETGVETMIGEEPGIGSVTGTGAGVLTGTGAWSWLEGWFRLGCQPQCLLGFGFRHRHALRLGHCNDFVLNTQGKRKPYFWRALWSASHLLSNSEVQAIPSKSATMTPECRPYPPPATGTLKCRLFGADTSFSAIGDGSGEDLWANWPSTSPRHSWGLGFTRLSSNRKHWSRNPLCVLIRELGHSSDNGRKIVDMVCRKLSSCDSTATLARQSILSVVQGLPGHMCT